MYVCMYVCVCIVCMYVCMYACMHAYICIGNYRFRFLLPCKLGDTHQFLLVVDERLSSSFEPSPFYWNHDRYRFGAGI